LLENFKSSTVEDIRLKSLFDMALQSYEIDLNIIRINFMDFPKVALISFEKARDLVNKSEIVPL
jgi:hypothetical protein